MADINLKSDKEINEIFKDCITNGDIHIFRNVDHLSEIISYSKKIISKYFNGNLDPQKAQELIPVLDYVEIVSKIKKEFTNSLETSKIIQNLLKSLNLQKQDIYFDEPKIRVITYENYLTSGVGYTFKPHRDTWYSGPSSQLNFWFPIYDVDKDSTFVIYPDYWRKKVKNSSKIFDYENWKKNSRYIAKKFIKEDSRNHPLPLENINNKNEVIADCKSGDLVVFSGSHLHATIPNTSKKTRFSIDFRILSKNIQESKIGYNVDSESTGSTIGDFSNSVNLKKYK